MGQGWFWLVGWGWGGQQDAPQRAKEQLCPLPGRSAAEQLTPQPTEQPTCAAEARTSSLK